MIDCEHEITLTEQTFSNGTKHLRKDCLKCGRMLGYQGYKTAADSVLFFGKYKGRTFLEVAKEDPDYLHWLAGQDIKPRLAKLIENAFERLKS